MRSPDDICAVCPATRQAHESTPPNHVFSDDGNLVPKEKKKPEAPQRPEAKPPTESPGITTRLALVMMKRDLITPDEFAWVLSGDPAVEQKVIRDAG